jgi:uncharacterized membrane protein
MSKHTALIWLLIVMLLIAVMPMGYAHAYLDPGSGSLIIQLLIGGLLGLAVVARLFWTNILVFLRIKKPTDMQDADDDTTE